METLNFAEQKISLAQTILALNDITKMYQIQSYVNQILKEQPVNDNEDDEYDAKKLSFEEWNEQFEDNLNMDDMIPEYGMTLKEFRLKIYNSERQEGMSKEEFLNKVNSWK